MKTHVVVNFFLFLTFTEWYKTHTSTICLRFLYGPVGNFVHPFQGWVILLNETYKLYAG